MLKIGKIINEPTMVVESGTILPPKYVISEVLDLNNYINASNISLTDQRMYFVAGQNEYSTIMTDINGVKNNLQLKGLTTANTLTKYDSFGTHSESYWRGEFAAAYQWLFANENLATTAIVKVKPTIFQT